MSIAASIDVKLENFHKKTTPIFEIIDVLINHGWTFNENKYITYLPFGDKDDFDWQTDENIDIAQLKKIFELKEHADEIVGIMMYWKNSEIGGSFLFWPSSTYETFSLNFNAFRPMINLQDNYEIIDFQWYLKRLLPCLDDAFGVESFSFEQHR